MLHVYRVGLDFRAPFAMNSPDAALSGLPVFIMGRLKYAPQLVIVAKAGVTG
jgi:hypothetical protein